MAFDHILIKYNVASKCLVPKCFGVFCMQPIRRLIVLHHISVCLGDYVICCIRLKKLVDGLKVRRYGTFLLTLF